MSTGTRVLVLGGSGFIGQAVVRECEASGFDVVAPPSSEVGLRSSNAAHVLGSLLTDDTILVALARAKARPDRWKMFQDDIAMTATVGLAMAARRPRKCVYCSSISVYGDDVSNLAITEGTPLTPSSPYGQAKLAGERIIQQAADQSGTPMLTLRPCMAYGPGDATTAYGPSRLVREALAGRVSIFGDGRDLRPYLFIDDMARMIVALMESASQGVYNVAPGSSHSFVDIVDFLRSVSARDFKITSVQRHRPRVDLMVDPAKLDVALSGTTLTSLDEGVRATYDAYRPVDPAAGTL